MGERNRRQKGGVKAWKRINFGWDLTEEHKLGRPTVAKYEDYKNNHFSGAPGNNVLGATCALPCITTAKSITKIFNSQEGADTKLSELTLPTALELGPKLLLCRTWPSGFWCYGRLRVPEAGGWSVWEWGKSRGLGQWFFTNCYRCIWMF